MKAKNPSREERLAAALRENLKRRKAKDRSTATRQGLHAETALEQHQNEALKPE